MQLAGSKHLKLHWSCTITLGLAALLLVLSACQKQPNRKTPVAAKQAAESERPRAVQHEDQSGTATPAAKPTADKPGQEPLEEATTLVHDDDQQSQEATEAQPAADQPLPSERLLLMAPAGPLIVEVAMSIDGSPYDAALRTVVDQVLQLADSDGDGYPTWEELTTHRRFMYGQFGASTILNQANRQQVIQQYDVDRDKVVDADEVPRLLAGGAMSSRAFALDPTSAPGGYGVLDSPLAELLDWDQNGFLSQEEVAEAPGRIISRDADNDRIVIASDLRSTLENEMMGGMPRRRMSGPDKAVLLNDHTSWNTLLYSLGELYDVGSRPDAELYPLLADLFDRLDGDQNEQLDEFELMNMLTIEPHLKLEAHFGQQDSRTTPTLQLQTLPDQVDAAASVLAQSDNAATIQLNGARLQLALIDTVADQDYGRQAEMNLARLDTDENGYLEEDELDGFTIPRIEAADEDEDGKVVLEELVSFFKQRQALDRSQLRARAGTDEDPLFAALDSDYDRRLTQREIEAIADRLREIDRNQDGRITNSEVPGSLMLLISRGAAAGETLPAMPVAATGPKESAGWFTAMDSNSDGEISWREFLGTRDQFQQLDSNSDGFLRWDELTASATDAQ